METTIQKFFRQLTLVLLSCVILASCTNIKNGYNNNTGPSLTASDYLQLAATSEGQAKQMYLLKAANRLIQRRQPITAQRILNTIPTLDLPENLAAKKQILQANVYILNHQNRQAIKQLNNISPQFNQLPKTDQLAWLQLSAYANNKTGNVVKSIQNRTQMLKLLPNEATKKQDLVAIWQILQSLNQKALTQYYQNAATPYLKGWFSLALITNQESSNSAKLSQDLALWRAQYPNHLANLILPQKGVIQANITQQPKRIALLLPLSGKLAQAGNAIRNGFFAAYFNAKKKQTNLPNVAIYDTAQGNVSTIYNKAVSEGADFVVGPLTKTNLNQLISKTPISVPTLALNSISHQHEKLSKNLFEFGLSPIDEANQAAQKAWDMHYSRALIIAPANAWGQQVAQAFSNTWQALGGEVIKQMNYTNQQSLASGISTLLNIDQSYAREKALHRILREKFRTVIRRRRDADVIFLVARPNMASQIKPLLKYFYAGNIPVFATSQIFSGNVNQYRDRDLNGIIFCDMPWVLLPKKMQPTNLDTMQTLSKKLWTKSYKQYPKLYALGVDAYDVIPNIDRLLLLPQLGVKAATGTLYINPQHHLYRELVWSKMINGSPKVIQ